MARTKDDMSAFDPSHNPANIDWDATDKKNICRPRGQPFEMVKKPGTPYEEFKAYADSQQPVGDPAHEFAKEFDRRIQQAIINADGSLPTDLSIAAQHGAIRVDHDGTRRFFWRGEEKFHMRIDVNWREDGQ